MNKPLEHLAFAEYVSPGHPDKVADIISQYILDQYIKRDPNVRYAIEAMIKGNTVTLSGELTTTEGEFNIIEYKNYVREALEGIGYTHEYFLKWGRDNCIDPWEIDVNPYGIRTQSPEIAQGVNNDGWGDQGVFYGYADPNGDAYYMPLAHSYARGLCFMLYNQALNGLGGIDIKTEVIMDGNKIVKIYAAVPCLDMHEELKIRESIINWYQTQFSGDLPLIVLNGTGSYMRHGPIADCGVTGRKLVVDFYGGGYAVGGGAAIKDATKADVGLNLYARRMALEFALANGKPVKVSLACCIGQSDVTYCVESFDGEIIERGSLTLIPNEVKERFHLDKPIYSSMHTFGLFGENQQDKEWEYQAAFRFIAGAGLLNKK